MQHTTETPKQYQCRHIFTDGRRCSSPCLRQQEFCYYHHTTRRPVANPTQRRTRRSTFHLPLPEDRSAIQASIGEVLQRIAANEIDPRRAGLLLYGLQIASLNLPKTPAHRNAKPEPVEFVEEITTDPELGDLAPRAEVSEKTERKSTVAKLIERIMQGEPPPPSERIPQNEHQPARNPEPATIPTLQATADNLHNPHERTKKAPKKLRHPAAQCLLSTSTNQRRRHPDRSCSQHYREQRSGGTPAFRICRCSCCCLFSRPSTYPKNRVIPTGAQRSGGPRISFLLLLVLNQRDSPNRNIHHRLLSFLH
ncbi:MAG TPA: hypothetical protein VHS13_04915 [Edaphobacter sp.]|nr:hypothetical protein [Edaphobacter sp.]